MKRKSFLAALIAGLAFTSSANGQLYTPAGNVVGSTGGNISMGANVNSPWELHIEAPNGGASAAEKLIRTRVNDNSYDFFDINNSITDQSQFSPLLWGYRGTSSTSGPALTLLGSCVNGTDAGSNPMMKFEVKKHTSDPGSITSQPSTTYNGIVTRPQFDWVNNGSVQMRMDGNGDVGIGTGTGNIDSRLVIQGNDNTYANFGLTVTNTTNASDAPNFCVRNDGRVALGTNTYAQMGGKLTVKSSGNTSGTAGLYVINSDNTQTLLVADDGTLDVGNPSISSGRINVDGTAASGNILSGLYTVIGGASGSISSYGVRAQVSSSGSKSYGLYATSDDADDSYGAYIDAKNSTATGSKEVYGVWARARETGGTSGNTIYGVYGAASGSVGNTVYAGYFSGDVYSTGSYVSSDQSLKMDVRPYNGALDVLSRLQTKTYEYNRAQFPSMNLPEGRQIGLIAQEVEQVFPDLVKATAQPAIKDEKGNILHERVDFKAVNYTGLVPVLVEGIQEQQDEIEALKQQVAELSAMVSKLSGNTTVTDINTSLGTLYQNTPNPTNSSTTIRYSLSPEVAQMGAAEIVITDAQRTSEYQRMSVGAGAGEIEIKAGTLFPGTYIYSLVVSGKIVDSKKMLIMP